MDQTRSDSPDRLDGVEQRELDSARKTLAELLARFESARLPCRVITANGNLMDWTRVFALARNDARPEHERIKALLLIREKYRKGKDKCQAT